MSSSEVVKSLSFKTKRWDKQQNIFHQKSGALKEGIARTPPDFGRNPLPVGRGAPSPRGCRSCSAWTLPWLLLTDPLQKVRFTFWGFSSENTFILHTISGNRLNIFLGGFSGKPDLISTKKIKSLKIRCPIAELPSPETARSAPAPRAARLPKAKAFGGVWVQNPGSPPVNIPIQPLN